MLGYVPVKTPCFQTPEDRMSVISTKSTEKPSQGAQNLITIVLSLPHCDKDNIHARC